MKRCLTLLAFSFFLNGSMATGTEVDNTTCSSFLYGEIKEAKLKRSKLQPHGAAQVGGLIVAGALFPLIPIAWGSGLFYRNWQLSKLERYGRYVSELGLWQGSAPEQVLKADKRGVNAAEIQSIVQFDLERHLTESLICKILMQKGRKAATNFIVQDLIPRTQATIKFQKAQEALQETHELIERAAKLRKAYSM